MKFNCVVTVFFLVIAFTPNFLSQSDWFRVSDWPTQNSPFKLYTGTDNGNSVQFALTGNATGLFKSIDAGANWVNIGLNGITLTDFYDNPDNSGEHVVTAADGVYITSDGGATWPHHNSGIEGLYVTHVTKFFNSLIIGTSTNGVYESTDGGATFQQMGTGLENKFVSRVEAIYMSEEDDGIYAIIQGEGVYFFDEMSNTWLPINDGGPSLFNNTAISSDNQSLLFLGNYDTGIYSAPADQVMWQLEINFPFVNDIIATFDGQVYASSLGNGIIVRDFYGIWTDFSDGIDADPDNYIDVGNIAFSITDKYLWATYTPLHPSMTAGIYRTTNPVTDVDENTIVAPEDYRLEQNYPNPFNPSTTIKWQLASASNVTIKLFNSLGEELQTLFNEFQQAGIYSKSITLNSELPSGVYFYKIQAGDFNETKKMILLK